MFIDASFLVWYNYKYRESVVSVRFLREMKVSRNNFQDGEAFGIPKRQTERFTGRTAR